MTAGASATSIRLRVNGARLHVRIADGDGGAAPGAKDPAPRNVLLLHGGGPGTCGEAWTAMIREGIPGCRFFAPDHVGFGESDAPADVDYGSERFVDDAIALMTMLCLEPAVVVGHSMGAAIAATIAVRRPDLVSRLVLIAPGGGTYGLRSPSPGIEQIGRVANEPTESNMRALVALMSPRRETHDAEVRKRMALIARPGLIEVQQRLDRGRRSATAASAAGRASVGGKLRGTNIPVMLLWGAEEVFNPFELGAQIRDALPPHAQYRVIEGAGHNVQYDQPRAVARALSEFLGA